MAKDCPGILKVLHYQHQEKQVSKLLNENNPTIRHRHEFWWNSKLKIREKISKKIKICL